MVVNVVVELLLPDVKVLEPTIYSLPTMVKLASDPASFHVQNCQLYWSLEENHEN